MLGGYEEAKNERANVLFRWSAHEWTEIFNNVQTDMSDADCSGCLSTLMRMARMNIPEPQYSMTVQQ